MAARPGSPSSARLLRSAAYCGTRWICLGMLLLPQAQDGDDDDDDDDDVRCGVARALYRYTSLTPRALDYSSLLLWSGRKSPGSRADTHGGRTQDAATLAPA